MKEKILQNLGAVIGALNAINVSGKSNLENLWGSIDYIEKTCKMVSECEIKEPEEK